jgi:uncharacterized protein (DUF885 family)
MRKLMPILIAALIALAALSCTGPALQDAEFEGLTDRYLERLVEVYPTWATYLGDHRYDHLLVDYTPDRLAERRAFHAAYLDSLAVIDPERLGTANRIDYLILAEDLRYRLFAADTIQGYRWNPRTYNPGGAIYVLLARDFAPLEERLGSVKKRLEAIPRLLEQGKANLDNPPKIHTETAILQIQGTINMIRHELDGFLANAPDQKAALAPARETALAALEEYKQWLEEDLLPRSNGEFRLGEEIFRAKLRYALESDIAPATILAMAEAELEATHATLFETAIPLYTEYFGEPDSVTLSDRKGLVRRVLDRIADDHPTAENIVEKAEATLTECEAFVREHDLVTIPDEPLKIIVMPEFQRGVAVAYCDSPGPYEEKGETFYAISPPPADWDEKQVESYFREYNNHALYDLTIHEAMPGHFLQLSIANRIEAPTDIMKIFGSGPFIEGWATYCEQMMVEHGFGGPELKMEVLKKRLRMVINVIIDNRIHTAGMTEEEAMDLMVNEGFQEESEAAGKWRRACLTSTQLTTYFAGNVGVNEIRRDWEAIHGQGNLKAFHDQLISYGSPPVKYLRELMEL